MVNEFKIKQEMCEIGRKIYAKGFAAANDGNISYRVDDNHVFCSPTLISKGEMKPDDICTVDMTGKQIAGRKKRTSEVLLHLDIYKACADVRAVVHCHPPHATAFGLARVDIPTGILPEAEIFLGVVPRADYETPGTAAFARSVRPFIGKANTVVLSNHGTVSWAGSLERAFWQTETLDSYCRILLLTRQLGNIERLSEPAVRELLKVKAKLGAGGDPRLSGDNPLFVNTGFGTAEEADNE